MTVSTLLLATVLQSQPALESGLGDVRFNWTYNRRPEAVFELEAGDWQHTTQLNEVDPRLQNMARDRFVERGDVLDGDQLGLNIAIHPRTGAAPANEGWHFVVGFENERLEISPGATGAALLYRGGTVSVADGYAGMARPVGDRALVTFGYVRQERTAFAAAREWSDDSHFLGMTYQLSW